MGCKQWGFSSGGLLEKPEVDFWGGGLGCADVAAGSKFQIEIGRNAFQFVGQVFAGADGFIGLEVAVSGQVGEVVLVF